MKLIDAQVPSSDADVHQTLFREMLLHVLLVLLLLVLVEHLSTDRAVEHLSEVLLHVALKVGASSREVGVTPRAVHLLLLGVHLHLLGLPLHAVRSWLPWLQLWDRDRCNLRQEGRREGGLERAGRLREWLEQRRLVSRAGDGCPYLGAVHVPLRRCQGGEGKVGRVYVETSGTHGAAPTHLAAERAELQFLRCSANLQLLPQTMHLLFQCGHSLPLPLLLLQLLLGCCQLPVMFCPGLQPRSQLLALNLQPLHLLLQPPLLHLQLLGSFIRILQAPFMDLQDLLLPLQGLQHLGIHAGSLLGGSLPSSNIHLHLSLLHLPLLLFQPRAQRRQNSFTRLDLPASLNQVGLRPRRLLLGGRQTSPQLVLLSNLCPDLSDSKVLAPHSRCNHGLAVLQPREQAPLLLQQSLSSTLLSCQHSHQALPVLLALGGLLQLGLEPGHLPVLGRQGRLCLMQPRRRCLQHGFCPSQCLLGGSQSLFQFRPGGHKLSQVRFHLCFLLRLLAH